MIHRYMQSAEFKARQLWLPFSDAVGIVLQILEERKQKAWSGSKITSSRAENLTLVLPFEILKHRGWQQKAQQVYLKLETA